MGDDAQKKWDGKLRVKKPLFCQGVEGCSEGELRGLNGEVQAIRKHLEELVGLLVC